MVFVALAIFSAATGYATKASLMLRHGPTSHWMHTASLVMVIAVIVVLADPWWVGFFCAPVCFVAGGVASNLFFVKVVRSPSVDAEESAFDTYAKIAGLCQFVEIIGLLGFAYFVAEEFRWI